MNILQILPELNVGGVETGTMDLSRQLTSLGHKVVVVSNGGELVKELESYGAVHYYLPVHKKSIITVIRAIPRLVAIIKKEKIEVVHARSRVPAWVAYFATRKTGVAFVTTCHGYYTKHPFSYVMGWAKRVIVISQVIGRHMIDDFGVSFDNIRFIPRSVDISKFTYRNPAGKRGQEFNVGIIGRITPIKGHLDFVKAMAKVYKAVPNLKVWIVGEVSSSRQAYKDQLQILVKRLGLWQATQFLGTQRDIPGILSHLDLVVLATNTHEAFGRVIVEAMASGVPVVATRVGGVVDIIEDGKSGLLVAPADPAGMAEAAVRIYKDTELANRLSQNAYVKVKEQYNIELMTERTLAVYRDVLSNLKILVIKMSSLGDVILSTAAIRAIRQKFSPDSGPLKYKISVVVSQAVKDVLMNCPYIDEILVCDFKNRDRGLKGFWSFANSLRRKNFDLIIDFQNNRRSHLLSFLALGTSRYGYDNGKFAFLLNKRIKDDKAAIDPIAHQFRILKELGIELKDPRLEMWPAEDDRLFAEEFLKSQWLSPNQKLIGINIGASPRWVTKNWPLEHIARLCDELNARAIRVVITGTQKDASSAEKLALLVKSAKLINACGKTSINQLACLIKSCGVYISPDSASLHIAASVNTPFIALFGPTDYRRHVPPAKDCIVIQKALTCAPCYKTKCKTVKCMKMITPEEVMDAVIKLIPKE